MGKKKDRWERLKALGEDPDFRALVDILKGLPQDRVDDFFDEVAEAGDEQDAQDKED